MAPPAVRFVPSRLDEKAVPPPSSPPPLKCRPVRHDPRPIKRGRKVDLRRARGDRVWRRAPRRWRPSGKVMLLTDLGGVERERVLVDVELPGLLRPVGRVAIAGRERRRLAGVPLRKRPVADRLRERRRRPVGVGHGEGLIRLVAVDAGRQQLERGVVARGQRRWSARRR